jgi:hypothetical protein
VESLRSKEERKRKDEISHSGSLVNASPYELFYYIGSPYSPSKNELF